MKSLAERHADRAQRKADNAAESTTGAYGGVSAAMALFGDFVDLTSNLTIAQRDELKEAMKTAYPNDPFGGDPTNGRSIAEGEDGGLALAGIGAVNGAIVPGAKLAEVRAGEGQTGELPASNIDPAEGNASGQAMAAATEGWGAPPPDGADPAPTGSGKGKGKGSSGAPAGNGGAEGSGGAQA
jgi:hypothetical protein